MQKKTEKIELRQSRESHEAHESFIENQNNCPLCSSELVIEVETVEEELTLKELAKCPDCDLLARVKDHNLH